MNLPPLLLVADGFATGRGGRNAEQLHDCFVSAVRAGVRWVQLRDHNADPELFAGCARQLSTRLRETSSAVLLSVNTHGGVATELGAGLHLGRRGPSLEEGRQQVPSGVLTAAVHDLDEAEAALRAGADALVFAPVYATPSKPDEPGAGVEALAAVCGLAGDTPVIALGGMRPERVAECLAAGAYGVAVLSAIVDARPAVAPIIVSAFLHALDGAR